MKKYIQPESMPVSLQSEGFLAASGLTTSPEIGDEGDYARRKRGGWSSEQWSSAEEGEQ